MKNNASKIVFIAVAALSLAGCARQISPNVYTETHVGEASTTYRGMVVSVRQVRVAPEKLEENATGTALGGVAGGVAGYQFGQGRGQVAATAAGALLGAIAGNLAENELKSQDAYEYVVELESGTLKTVVQGMDVKLNPGDRVLLIVGQKGRSRLVANPSKV